MENKTSKKIFLVMFICFMILASFNIIKVEGACTTPADEDYYVKGKTEGKAGWEESTVTKIDSCYDCNNGANTFDSCYAGSSCCVSEWYCVNDKVYSTSLNCPNGCKDGACIKETDIKPECIKEGARGTSGDVCCKGLKNVGNWAPMSNGECTNYRNPSFICTNCGDGNCGLGENYCNCPEDCKESKECVGEGGKGSMFDGDPNNNICCVGLEKVQNSYPIEEGVSYPMKDPYTIEKSPDYPTKGCLLFRSGFVCTKCGDGICGKGENECNCPEDCKEEEKISCNTQEIFAKCGSLKNSYTSFTCKTVKPCGRYVLFSDITTSCPDISSTPYCSAGDCYGVKKLTTKRSW